MRSGLDPNFVLGPIDAAMFQRAASGDRAVQRDIAEGCMRAHEAAVAAGGADDLAAFEAVLFARLAAAGGDDADAMQLTAALSHASNAVGRRGYGALADNLTVEALAILSALAGAGHSEAAGTIALVVADVSPVLLRRAQQLAMAARPADAS